jgi:hypothetical protein
MSGPQPHALAAAIELLGTLLERHEGAVPSTELAREAAAAGISARTMTRARAMLGTAAIRRGGSWVIIRPWPTREVH